MTTQTRANETNLLGRRNRLVVIAALVLVPGCTFIPPPPPPDVQPDMKAIAVVVEEACSRLGQAASVFLAADGVGDTTMARVRIALTSDPETAFHAPCERAHEPVVATIACVQP